jgi:hypothetical protein
MMKKVHWIRHGHCTANAAVERVITDAGFQHHEINEVLHGNKVGERVVL